MVVECKFVLRTPSQRRAQAVDANVTQERQVTRYVRLLPNPIVPVCHVVVCHAHGLVAGDVERNGQKTCPRNILSNFDSRALLVPLLTRTTSNSTSLVVANDDGDVLTHVYQPWPSPDKHAERVRQWREQAVCFTADDQGARTGHGCGRSLLNGISLITKMPCGTESTANATSWRNTRIESGDGQNDTIC